MTENTKRVAGHYAGGEEVAAYAPVPDVLFQLVKYWYWLLLGREWDYFLTGCSGQGKEAAFARRCIALAAKAIGEAAVERAIEEARDEFKAKVDSARVWEIFESGDWGQLETVKDDWVQKLYE